MLPAVDIERVYANIAPTSQLTSTVRYCFGGEDTGDRRYDLGYYTKIEVRLGKYYYPKNSSLDVFNEIILIPSTGKYYVDGVVGSGVVMTPTSRTFTLFKMRSSSGALATDAKTHPCKIKEFIAYGDAAGTNVILDLIAVAKDNVGYMYDRVSGQLFGNAGTGSFVLGPVVSD